MATLAELITRSYLPEPKDQHKPTITALTTHIEPTRDSESYRFEADAFNFLLDNKEQLGIRKVMKFTALLVDGAVELVDGQRLTVEIKYRMNWTKACQAEWQFRTFLKRHQSVVGTVNGGVVLFEEFEGDGWQRQAACRLYENGWSHWYRGNAMVDGLRLDLFRLRKATLESFPLHAQALIQQIETSTDDAKAQFFADLQKEYDQGVR